MKSNVFVELTTTNACNCHCKYCFEGSHCQESRDIEEESRQIDILVESCKKFDKDAHQWFTISFWGGEPFMNFDFVDKIIRSTFSFEFVRYNFYTNGTLTDIISKFVYSDYIDSIRNRVRMQLSYDGEPIHSAMRGDNSALIFKTADILSKAGILPEFKATLPFSMMSHMSECWDSYKLLYDRYGQRVIYFPTIDTTETDMAQLPVFEKQLEEICKKEYMFFTEHSRYLLGWFIGHKFNCALNNTLFIHNDGKLYYCHGCPYKKDNDNLVKGTTKDITTVFDAMTTNAGSSYEFPRKCKLCSATYCAICHVSQIKPDDKPEEAWNSCRVNNTNRCKFFKAIGKYNRLLEYALNYT